MKSNPFVKKYLLSVLLKTKQIISVAPFVAVSVGNVPPGGFGTGENVTVPAAPEEG